MPEISNKNWYDTKEGFEKALSGGLASLGELSRARTEAYYVRRERLGWWLVLRHFVFDECGNTMVITENAPDYYSWGNAYPPQVVTKEEWQATNQRRPMSSVMGSIPPSGEVCPRCLEGWTLSNVNNYEAVSYYRTGTTPEEAASGKGRSQTHYHKDCRRLMIQQEDTRLFKEMLDKSGIVYTEMRAIPNGYSSSYASSWWIVETNYGPIKIGPRKRVISISWDNAPGLKDVDGRKVFEDQVVTKDRYLIHAWSDDAAIKYLRALMSAGLRGS